MSIARFHKIDGPFVFRSPHPFHHLITLFVDLDEAARRQDRVHGEILVPDVAVGKIGMGELRQISQRYQAPLLDHAA